MFQLKICEYLRNYCIIFKLLSKQTIVKKFIMFFTTKSKRQLYYETQISNNTGETLVLLNGLSQSTVAWILSTPHLRNYNIITLDFIFQGKSDKTGDYQNFDEHADDVSGLLDELKIEKAVICGISYGSLVSQHFAVKYPEKTKKLILMSTFCRKTPYYNAIELAWTNALQAGGYSLMLDVMLPTVLSEAYFQSPLIPIELMKATRQESTNDSSALLKLMRATKERKDFRQSLNKIKTPTLVIHGEKDLLFLVYMGEEVAKNIGGAKFEIIKGAGHTLNLEAVPQMVALIKTL